MSHTMIESATHTARRRGFHLLEALVVFAVLTFTAAVGIPRLLEATSSLRVRLAAAEVAGALQLARQQAVRRHWNVAVKFRSDADGVSWALYRDGDGDGVRNRDIDRGIDPMVRAPHRLAHFGALVRFGFPPGEAPRDPGDPRRRLDRLDDPIRFNRSDLASFSPLGTASSGSVYLSDGRRHLAVVRLLGASAKVTVRVYDLETERWR